MGKDEYWWIQYKDYGPELVVFDGEIMWFFNGDYIHINAEDFSKYQFLYKVEYDFSHPKESPS